jgi:hypothetical protein
MFGAFGMAVTPQETRVTTIDPRHTERSVRVYDDSRVARREFNRELSITLARGWQVIYDGPPLGG